MSLLKKILYYYCFFLTLILFSQGLRLAKTPADLALIFLLSAPTFYFFFVFLGLFQKKIFLRSEIKEVLFYLKIISLVNSFFLFFISLFGLMFYFQYLFVFVFLPLPLYFLVHDIDKDFSEEELLLQDEQREKVDIKEQKQSSVNLSVDLNNKIRDPQRRQFLKTLGVGGFGLLLAALFSPKKAEAAFFGSVPGPGTVALKNAAGQKIDPAEKKPTDGYSISQIDSNIPSYYGFIDKEGRWYIIKEDTDGSFRYVRGVSSFSTYWTNRSLLSYDYFDNVF